MNPASIRLTASSGVLAILHVHSSVSAKNVACSMLMYIIVDSMLLCPKTYFTCMMSFVLWYSIVPLKCLNVWNVMFLRRGLANFASAKIL